MNRIDVGFGSSLVTPGLGVYMAGYFEKRRSTAMHDELYARAMVFDDGATRGALLCCDLITVPAEEVAKIREIVEARTGIPGKNVMVCGTHTHTGPNTRRGSLEEDDPTIEWLDGMPARAAEAVVAAVGDMEGCTLAGGSAFEDRIAFNRRYHMKDGTVRSNPGHMNPEIVEPAGPIDPEVGVLSFRREDGTLKGLYVNYACHLDNVGGTEISADFPGYLVNRLQERVVGRPAVLFTNGSCGDINHIDTRSRHRRKGHEHSRWMGETLAGDACVALEQMEEVAAGPVRIASEVIQLPMKEDADQSIGQTEIQVMRVGEVAFVGVPAEYFVELQLDIKERSPFARTYISELANGCIGYVPTRKAFAENMKDVSSERMEQFDHMGYEVRSALSRGYLPGIGEAMADAAVRLLEQVTC